MADFLNEIQNIDVDAINKLVDDKLEQIYNEAEKVEYLGFFGNTENVNPHRGIIPRETRIKFGSLEFADYSMKTTDYFYDFVKIIKENNISTKGAVIKLLQYFSIMYFGLNKNIRDLRTKLLQDNAWDIATTDEEFWDILENNEIGDFKGKNIAMCSERAALAQNLLTLFNFNSYYCQGLVK